MNETDGMRDIGNSGLPEALNNGKHIIGKTKKDTQDEITDYKNLLTALESFIRKQGRTLYISDQETGLAPLIGALRCEIFELEGEIPK